ncbi:nitrate/nitrite two-component system sensor histidine kinase NarQ [Enterobacteriaceae bacterium LUAb1]
MQVKRSVTASIARLLSCVVGLAIFCCGLALLTLSGSLHDASAINIAGSLRMQSYRLALDLHQHRANLPEHLTVFHHSLNAPDLTHLDNPWIPPEVRKQYLNLLSHWQPLEEMLRGQHPEQYQQHYQAWVTQIDHFVLVLQKYTELKIMLAAGLSLMGLLAIVALVAWTIRMIRREVVSPLGKLMNASHQIKLGRFHYPVLDTQLPNELGALSLTFSRMSQQLERHYQQLEQVVRKKTADLTRANRMLETLYACSQVLTTHPLSPELFQKVLALVLEREQLTCLELRMDPHWQQRQGQPVSGLIWYQQDLPLEKGQGQLRWQIGTVSPSTPLMESIAHMLARALWRNQMQKQHQQLLLMEERATIARELHDSLAQSLTFLRIQITRLKRTMARDNQQSDEILAEVEEALAEAYQQLRELLTTFRLTIDATDLTAALQALLASLRQQTCASLTLNCQLDSQLLDAAQQVHVLQIIREAALNAIRHSQASQITIHCQPFGTKENLIEIKDNGTGIIGIKEPEGHYGLTIMQERAQRLGGQLSIRQVPEGGTCISLVFPSLPVSATDIPSPF